MATAKERLLISLSPRAVREITKIAKSARIPRATQISQWVEKMIDDHIEDQEDRLLSKLAYERYAEWERMGKKTYTHEEVWAAVKNKKR